MIISDNESYIKLNINTHTHSETIDYLKLLVEHAETKNNHIDRLRQMNFSITLFVFAGLAGFGLSQDTTEVMLCVTIVLVAFMLILSSYDHRLHQYLHGMEKTKVTLLRTLSDVICKRVPEVSIKHYYKDGENRAKEENCHSIRDFLRFVENWAKGKNYHSIGGFLGFIMKSQDAGKTIPSRMRVVYYLLIRGALASLIPFFLKKFASC